MIKKIVLSVFLLLIVGSAQAQRKKKAVEKGAELPKTTVEEALANYDFETAEELLTSEMAALAKKKQSTEAKELQLQWLRKAQIKLNAVERVTFIDSLVVPRSEVLRHIHLSPECGTLATYADVFKTTDKADCTVFQSQMGDQIFYARPDAKGVTSLYAQTLYGDGTKSDAQLLKGISDNGDNQNYPFVMTDGTTIYFASQGDESLGGYDIFMSRYDADERRFLAPENIGMPFNSPANDYLYIIDETYNLGWFVTDRNQPAGKVCIYVFIPNETRRVYVPEEMEAKKLSQLARLTSIEATWTNANEVRGAQFRLNEAKNTLQAEHEHEFEFIVTDNQIYHQRTDFRSQEALQVFDCRVKNLDELYKVTTTLARLRSTYHNATEEQRKGLRGEILMLEKSEGNLTEEIRQQEKEIRKMELGL